MSIYNKFIPFLLIFAALSFILPNCILFSQNKTDTLKTAIDSTNGEGIETEELVVTGTRTTKKIIDIPYSVFRVDTREFKYGRNVSAKDVLADVPGLFLQARYGNDVRISIRGFGTRSNSGVKGIRILQDGIPESDPDGETAIDAIDFTSLGGVEVVKGNLSSLYTNSPGGVINFISDINFPQNFVKQTNEIGDYGLRQNGLKFGVHSKNYRYYVSYSYRNYNGYREHSSEYINLVNSYYQAYLDSKTSISVLGNFVKGFIRLPGSLTKDEYNANPFQAYNYAVSSDWKRITSKGRLGVRFNTLFGKKNTNEIEITGFGSIKDLESTTTTLYNISNKYILGSTIRYVNTMPILKRENEFSAGIDYFFVNGPISSYANVQGNKGDDLNSQHLESLANLGGYFQDQFNIVKKKSFILFSGRYDKLVFKNDNQLFESQSSQRIFDKLTPKIALNYKITPHIALYTSYGFGFDTPSTTELENYPYSSNHGSTTLNPDIKAQSSGNFEFGIKGNIFDEEELKGKKNKHEEELFKKFYFEFTFFNSVINDEIVPLIIGTTSYFRNAAKTIHTGVECGIKAEAFEGLELTLNYTYTHFRYKTYSAEALDSVGDFIFTSYDGNVVPAVPAHFLNFIAEYNYSFTKKLTGLALFDCDYASKMFVDDRNTENTDSYFYASTLLGLDYRFKNFSVLLSGGVNNIFNKKYVGFININANPESLINQRRYYEPGEPRSYYVNLNFGYTF